MGRVLAVGWIAALLVTTTGAIAPTPAVAQTPTVTVTPDHVVDGQTVTVEMSGLGDWGLILECPATVETTGPPPAGCRTLTWQLPGSPSRRDVTVVSAFLDERGQIVNCHRAPGCVVGFWSAREAAGFYAPIHFGPDIRATPLLRNLSDGSTTQVVGGDIPAGDWAIAQCGRAFVDDPTPAQAAALCAAPTPVSPDADAAFVADLVVHDPLTSSGGATVPCGYSGCVVVLSEADQPLVHHVAVSFGPPRLLVTPSTELFDRQVVELTLSGAPQGIRYVQCLLPLASDLDETVCGTPVAIGVDPWGGSTSPLPIPATVRTPDDCRTGSCALVMVDDTGAFLGDPAPITFRPPPSISSEPTTGLLDGQLIEITGQDVYPGDYQLYHCVDGGCTEPSTLSVGSDGLLSTTVPALQRFTQNGINVYCRVGDCSVVLHHTSGWFPEVLMPYEMAAGELSASPDTGLSDGQTVQISGTDLMPTYDGAPIWVFPTGGWALTQCDAAILDDLSLMGVFTHCSVPPPTRDVTVDGSTLDTTLDVESTITKLLGGTTDCTASPGACVVGLVRLEQDGSLSSHLNPVSFSR